MSRILNVLTQSDENYALVGLTGIASILENNKAMEEINIFYLCVGIEEKTKLKMQNFVKKYKNAKLVLIDAAPYIKELKSLGVSEWKGLIVTWCKLLAIDDLPIETDRVLYLNPHSIVNDDLDYLVNLDLTGYVMGNIYDTIPHGHLKNINFDYNDSYFNCGIMLVNYSLWKQENIGLFVREKLKEKSDYRIVDQDFCNIHFKDRIKLLPFEYYVFDMIYAYKDRKNFLAANNLLNKPYYYSLEEQMSGYYSAKIIYSTFRAAGFPWQKDSLSPTRYLWEKYMKLIEWNEAERPKAKKGLTYYAYKVLPNKLIPRINYYILNRKFKKERYN
ncbi:hypothetical protein OGZ44_05335 [Lactococcus lactis]|uniref:glycosyltransferase family 8 protein n=1 Tax=Lactococcus lactis TaxID=1358 RepID=UPI001F1A4C72|nr:glycosyltransferase [Lactococcus lactis]MCG1000941.1 hypothetical protein [Lactococcus lactis]MDG4973663.1 hypothetical protein [Lactococcus lactis]